MRWGGEFWVVPGQCGASPARGAGLTEPRAPVGSPPSDSRDTCHICGWGALAPAFVPARRSPGKPRRRRGPGHAWAARGAGAGEEEEEKGEEEQEQRQQPRGLGGRGRKAGAEAEL